LRAVRGLQGDIKRVSGAEPKINREINLGVAGHTADAVVIGTLGKSALVDGLVKAFLPSSTAASSSMTRRQRWRLEILDDGPRVVLEKLVIQTTPGAVHASYLGPPETFHR
jgi:hypothetical protein